MRVYPFFFSLEPLLKKYVHNLNSSFVMSQRALTPCEYLTQVSDDAFNQVFVLRLPCLSSSLVLPITSKEAAVRSANNVLLETLNSGLNILVLFFFLFFFFLLNLIGSSGL